MIARHFAIGGSRRVFGRRSGAPLSHGTCSPAWDYVISDMPLQNRVDPFGAVFRSPARGTMMGNRGGALHNDRREIVRVFKNPRWITCLLEFRGRHREVMSPGRYTELFFLDEATSFAAGHRPCAECRRDRFNAFRSAWSRPASATEIDAELHRKRIGLDGQKVKYQAAVQKLPDGCFIEIEGSPFLIWNDRLLLWTPEGYSHSARRHSDLTVTVLTPEPIVECFRRGYRPEIHFTAISPVGVK